LYEKCENPPLQRSYITEIKKVDIYKKKVPHLNVVEDFHAGTVILQNRAAFRLSHQA